MSISTSFDSQVRGLNQAIRNSNDGVSLAQTAEGALNETTNILQRVRELAVQSANDTNNANDRASLNAEVTQLNDEIDRIAETTNFNGNKLFDGNFLKRDLQVGSNVGETVSLSIQAAGAKDLGRQVWVTGGAVTAAQWNEHFRITGYKGSTDFGNTASLDDGVSSTLAATSAIAKSRAINSVFESTGVRAIVNETTFSFTDPVGGGTLDSSNFITINESKISGFVVQQGDTDGALRDAINAVSEDTGVIAGLSNNGELTLSAVDGRNIHVQRSGTARSTTGPRFDPVAQVTSRDDFVVIGSITLQSKERFEISTGTEIVHTDGVYGVNSDFAVSSVDLSERASALIAIDTIDLALEDVSLFRSQLGALQNRRARLKT